MTRKPLFAVALAVSLVGLAATPPAEAGYGCSSANASPRHHASGYASGGGSYRYFSGHRSRPAETAPVACFLVIDKVGDVMVRRKVCRPVGEGPDRAAAATGAAPRSRPAPPPASAAPARIVPPPGTPPSVPAAPAEPEIEVPITPDMNTAPPARPRLGSGRQQPAAPVTGGPLAPAEAPAAATASR